MSNQVNYQLQPSRTNILSFVNNDHEFAGVVSPSEQQRRLRKRDFTPSVILGMVSATDAGVPPSRPPVKLTQSATVRTFFKRDLTRSTTVNVSIDPVTKSDAEQRRANRPKFETLLDDPAEQVVVDNDNASHVPRSAKTPEPALAMGLVDFTNTNRFAQHPPQPQAQVRQMNTLNEPRTINHRGASPMSSSTETLVSLASNTAVDQTRDMSRTSNQSGVHLPPPSASLYSTDSRSRQHIISSKQSLNTTQPINETTFDATAPNRSAEGIYSMTTRTDTSFESVETQEDGQRNVQPVPPPPLPPRRVSGGQYGSNQSVSTTTCSVDSTPDVAQGILCFG
jgi:hypothetical protein